MGILNKKAFTLAEVLITLGIIGIVAAMTIPSLIQNYQKQQTLSQLQKAYSVFKQASTLSAQDNGDYNTWVFGTYGIKTDLNTYFQTYWAPYLKIAKYCTSVEECGYSSTTTCYNTASGACQTGIISDTTRVTFVLQDGMVGLVMGGASAQQVIDINGPKGPNVYGKDVFTFGISSTKGLIPWGSGSNCNATGSNPIYCAAKIIEDSWQIKSDYPFFN